MKVSHFETPRLSQVKLKRHSSLVVTGSNGEDEVVAPSQNENFDVNQEERGHRKIKLRKSS